MNDARKEHRIQYSYGAHTTAITLDGYSADEGRAMRQEIASAAGVDPKEVKREILQPEVQEIHSGGVRFDPESMQIIVSGVVVINWVDNFGWNDASDEQPNKGIEWAVRGFYNSLQWAEIDYMWGTEIARRLSAFVVKPELAHLTTDKRRRANLAVI